MNVDEKGSVMRVEINSKLLKRWSQDPYYLDNDHDYVCQLCGRIRMRHHDWCPHIWAVEKLKALNFDPR